MSRLNRRKLTSFKSSPLPADYLRMVTGVIINNFEAEMKSLKQHLGVSPEPSATGEVFPDEVLLSVSLVFPKQLKAVTVHASCDYDPMASSPKIDEVLGLCLDAAGGLLSGLLSAGAESKENAETLRSGNLDDLGTQPLEWAPLDIDKKRVFARVDRINPALDQAADAWLRANDPEYAAQEEEEQAETRKLFKTGPGSGKHGPH